MVDTQQIMSKLGFKFLSWKRLLQRLILPFNCTLKQHYLLNQLNMKEFMIPSQIAKHLFCDRPTASVVIKNLEKEGWIYKQKDPNNGRSFRIFITEPGKKKLEETSQSLKRVKDPLAKLSEAEKEQLFKLLEKIEI